MPMVDPSRGWWGEHCPARPADLSHAHERDCTAEAHEGRCCECGLGPNDRAGAWGTSQQGAHPAPPPPLDVQRRLEALGLNQPRVVRPSEQDTGMEDIRGEKDHTDDTPVEPRYRDPNGPGPQGTERGPGRGELTPRQKDALLKRAGYTDWANAKDGIV